MAHFFPSSPSSPSVGKASLEALSVPTDDDRLWPALYPEFFALRAPPRSGSAAAIAQLAASVRATPGWCERFEFRLVGSALEDPKRAGDIDIAISPQPGQRPTVQAVANVLIRLRWFGQHCVGAKVDPFFRRFGEAEVLARWETGTPMCTWVLANPFLVRRISKGHVCEPVRRTGRLVAVRRAPAQTDYFRKLPATTGRPELRPSADLIEYAPPEATGSAARA